MLLARKVLNMQLLNGDSTGVACVNTGRNFIGMEKDAGYYGIAKSRIEETAEQMRLMV